MSLALFALSALAPLNACRLAGMFRQSPKMARARRVQFVG
jgi:hypothetical protein